MTRAILLALLVSICSVAQAQNLEREQRLAEEMEANIFDGEVVYLTSGDHEFANAFIETDDARGGVILLHGRGFHPDWQDVVGPVRVALADAGWSTLSVQMPVLEKGMKYYDYVEIFPDAYTRI